MVNNDHKLPRTENCYISPKMSVVDIPQRRWHLREILIRSTSGTIMTGESPSTGLKSCPSIALSTKNPSWAGPVLPTSNGRSYARKGVDVVRFKDEMQHINGVNE